MTKRIILTLCLFGAIAFAKPYDIDLAHSSVDFEVKHLSLSKVNGNFDEFSGKVDVDPQTKTINALEGEISIASINTKNQKRDAHLNANDFFDSKKFPKAKFVMTKHEGNKIYGNLTFKNITKPVVFDIEVNGPAQNPMNKKEFMALDIQGVILRKDFDIGSSTGDMIVSNEVKISIQLEVYAK
ncbi:polyisoprenoid-binding protein [Helicobacter anseris]|uniref:Polyisoprenoid-binding protein n=1 Tax=Helicobacter anseris TaxID=375926 RepID=A0A3D8J9U8_9HELI|nr:YceI family protein [Helicobacter anseris]RDU73945.1 polyisoprenoid-binding protein [Helicobacter anseris]